MNDLHDATAAGELLAYALAPGRADERAYAELRTRFADDVDFAQLVAAFAAGIGLRVLGRNADALVVGPTESSVFSARLSDYTHGSQRLSGFEQRLLAGFAHLGLAAYCFPTPESLTRPGTVRIVARTVAEELTETAEQLASDAPEGTPVDSEELCEAWRAWLALPKVAFTDSGKLAVGRSRLAYVTGALGWLSDQGLVRGEGDLWRNTDAYRIHVANAAQDVKLSIVRSYWPGRTSVIDDDAVLAAALERSDRNATANGDPAAGHYAGAGPAADDPEGD